jgi:pyruvate, orthophosphate dikinase
MFFAEDRLPIVVRMILADNDADRKKALDELLPFQRADFQGLFQTLGGKPVTIRTIDPPLHEFLPKREVLMVEIERLRAANAPAADIEEKEQLLKRVNELHEFNPMMGLRGCRLGILMPDITRMQAQAIFEAALDVGGKVVPEVMIPLVGNVNELRHQKQIVHEVAAQVFRARGRKCKYLVGTMIEVPRAALTADQIAAEAEFFSFGTNDLTQFTLGISRDDAGKYLVKYQEMKILDDDPFVRLDRTGVGQLVRMATEKGRATRPDLKVGICGEHGGEPTSVEFCHQVGLNYVSCSPYRLPIARLAAAQAAIKEKRAKAKSNGRKSK